MTNSRVERRRDLEFRVTALFGHDVAPAALDLLELLEFAWHDCYGQVAPPDQVLEDVLFLSGGKLDSMIQACRLAVTDWRDLRVAADHRREGR